MCVRARLAQKKASPHRTQEFRRPIQKASTAKTSKSSSFGTLLSSQLKSLLCMYRIGNIKSSSASCQCLQPGACTELTEFDHITLPSFRLATLLEKRDVRRNCCLQISTRSRAHMAHISTSCTQARRKGNTALHLEIPCRCQILRRSCQCLPRILEYGDLLPACVASLLPFRLASCRNQQKNGSRISP